MLLGMLLSMLLGMLLCSAVHASLCMLLLCMLLCACCCSCCSVHAALYILHCTCCCTCCACLQLVQKGSINVSTGQQLRCQDLILPPPPFLRARQLTGCQSLGVHKLVLSTCVVQSVTDGEALHPYSAYLEACICKHMLYSLREGCAMACHHLFRLHNSAKTVIRYLYTERHTCLEQKPLV